MEFCSGQTLKEVIKDVTPKVWKDKAAAQASIPYSGSLLLNRYSYALYAFNRLCGSFSGNALTA